jgi:hypothetical protein
MAAKMRRKPPPAINPRMYRHFAVVTVAITALLAFFANGENHEALAAATRAQAAPDKPRAEQPKPLARQTVERPASWGTDVSDSFGEPMIRPSHQWAAWKPAPVAAAVRAATLPGALGSDVSEDPRQPEDAAPEPSAAQVAALAAASRLRSGSHGND